jgi:hypothetical protein
VVQWLPSCFCLFHRYFLVFFGSLSVHAVKSQCLGHGGCVHPFVCFVASCMQFESSFSGMSCVETYVPKTWRAPAHFIQSSFRQMTDDVRTSDVRILDEDPHNKNCECCQRLLQFLPCCCSFPQIEISSVCLCQGSL